jgi:serine/threonine protein kinase/formylglycine-generating enzyme required for sulfatase activity
MPDRSGAFPEAGWVKAVLCYRCGGHVKDGAERCTSCGQPLDRGLSAGFGNGYRRPRQTIEGAPCQAGEVIAGRYRVGEHVGAGPLGWMYRAAEVSTDDGVALKILSPRFLQMPEEKRTFLGELHKARRLSHPNIARIYEAGEDAGRPFIASQHLEGLTLRRIMDLRRQKGQKFTLQEVEPIVAQIAAALDAAAGAFAHGNLKPDNVVVLPDLLKLTDFGLAVSLPRAPFMAAQKAGGVHRYLAPEFLLGDPLDARTDVFSLGVMLGEMLSGERYEPQLNLLEKNPALPAAVEAIFRRAVAPRASVRFASAGEMASELSDLVQATPPSNMVPKGQVEDAGDVVIVDAQTDPRLRIARALEGDRKSEAATLPSPAPMPPLPFTPPPPYEPPAPVSSLVLAPVPQAPVEAPPAGVPAEPLQPMALDQPRPRRGVGKRTPRGRVRRSGAPLASEGDPAWGSSSPPATEGALAIGPTTSALEPLRPETPRIETPARAVRPVFLAAQEKPRARRHLYAAAAIALALIAGAVGATLAARSPVEAPPAPAQQAAAEPAPEPRKPARPEVTPDDVKTRSLREKVRSVREHVTKALAERKRKREKAIAEPAAVVTSIPAPEKSAPPAKPPPPAGVIRDLDDSEVLVAKERKVAAAASDFRCPPGTVNVEAGPASVGSDAADDLRNFGDRPPATVSLEPYCIDLYEFPNQPGKLPKVAAGFQEAESLCKNSGKRLCSEDEWEKACKGPQQLRFPYGQSFDADACNTQDKSDNPRQTTVAGAFTRCRSGYGLWDMSGNAAEWTASPFDAAGPEKAVKGGHAARPSFDDRCASRRKLAPGVHDVKVGFRCCADAR